jgi:hypothetical protein
MKSKSSRTPGPPRRRRTKRLLAERPEERPTAEQALRALEGVATSD